MAKEDPQGDLVEMVQKMQAPFMVHGASGAQIERLIEMQSILLKAA